MENEAQDKPSITEVLQKLVSDLDTLIDATYGVEGFWVSGGAVPWHRLRESEQFGDLMTSLDNARAVLKKIDAPRANGDR